MLLFSLLVFAFWAILITILYYIFNGSHLAIIGLNSENSIFGNPSMNQLIGYFLILLLIYITYKFFSSNEKQSKTTSFGFLKISGFTLLQIFGVSLLYSTLFNETGGTFTLFFHILQTLAYPLFLAFLWGSIGSSLFHFSEQWKAFPKRITVFIEIALGMGIFVFGLFVAGFFGYYTGGFLIFWIAILSILSFFGWKNTYSLLKQKIIFPTSPLSVRVISAEIAFIIITFVMAVSFISILRPMPIGWDDLGVYMNFPKIIATTGNLLDGAGMYTWHLITGTGFLLGQNASIAFFINQLGGILSTIAIIASISVFLEKINKENTTFLCLPMLLGIVYYLMPMTIFQQAKDMKLDPMLMFVSITAVMSMFLAFRHSYAKNSQKWTLILLGISGILTGIAFGIKPTTLMLIISLLALLSYQFLNFAGLIGFLGIFIAIFTQFKLWSQMFVWMPENSQHIVIGSAIIGIIGYIIAFSRGSSQKFITYILSCCIFIGGIFLTIFPWIYKNLDSAHWKNFSIQTILNGKGDNTPNGTFSPDFSKIYDQQTLEEKNKAYNFEMITENGQSLNEDFGRYFGQETGLNNYIKLPVNLTFQVNQTGEFTDITYIFLAFVPVALLLFAFYKGNHQKSQYWILGICLFLGLSLITFVSVFFSEKYISIFEKNPYISDFFHQFSKNITQFFANIQLPEAYGILLLLVIGFLALAHFCFGDEENPENKEKIGLLVLTGIYGLIFWVSAFGIVWYGVLIYFLFLVIIAIGINSINQKSPQNEITTGFLIFFALVLGIYLCGSSILHARQTLIYTGFNEYKYKKSGKETSIFYNKGTYFEALAHLNLQSPEKLGDDIANTLTSEYPRLFTKEYFKDFSLGGMHGALQGLLQRTSQNYYQVGNKKVPLSREQLEEGKKIHKILLKTLEPAYQKILYPNPQEANDGKIYRIGTFFTYFIHNNRNRYYEDSLVQNFQKYFYDKNPEVTIERMKKIGLKYLLIDLNAATIDKDERHDLTARYENLLLSTRAKNLRLISTDNFCLMFALDAYHDEYKDEKLRDEREFLNIAGTNYHSYVDGTKISKQQKIINCANYALKISQEANDKAYPYLLGIKARADDKVQDDVIQLTSQSGWFALFEIQ